MPGFVEVLEPWTIGVEIFLKSFWGFRVLPLYSYGSSVLLVTVTPPTFKYSPLLRLSLLFANFKVNPSTLSTKYNPSANKADPLDTTFSVSPFSLITLLVVVVLAA